MRKGRFRLSKGGRIDRNQPLAFTFDGRPQHGFAGETLAAALLANGEKIVARSFKYHRPRGVYSAGIEEPNAFVQLRQGAVTEPNTRATTTELFEGLVAAGQNAWPSVRHDLGAINSLVSPLIVAGFYYKTFIGVGKGTKTWMFFEKFIRRAAGMGVGSYEPDPDKYEKVNGFCDVLVVGGGPAGLAAALSAAQSGARVFLVEQDFELGGSLLSDAADGQSGRLRDQLVQLLGRYPNLKVLTRTTVFGAYDCGTYGLIERLADHLDAAPAHQPRQRYWLLRAKSVVMATGALERPLVFSGNDRPGVMLAGAVRTYANRYAVVPGDKVVVFTNNDSAYACARDLASLGKSVSLVDVRSAIPSDLRTPVEGAGVRLFLGHGVVHAEAGGELRGVIVAPVDPGTGIASGPTQRIPCDLLAVSGGWIPVAHLWSHLSRRPAFDAATGAFPAADIPEEKLFVAGSCAADVKLSQALAHGRAKGVEAARSVGFDATATTPGDSGFEKFADGWSRDLSPIWRCAQTSARRRAKAFIDIQHDVTESDVDLAHREGYQSLEHLKRYTTNGMAIDQGKTSNLNAMARMAELRSMTLKEIGTTTFRPPFTPVAIGALVGHDFGRNFRPTRLSPMHFDHVARGAQMVEAGLWMRPHYYPLKHETRDQAYRREAAHVRNRVGLVDVSTLGKIAVQGPDSGEFLDRIYVNGFKKLAVGSLRYGIMLREDGFLFDDGSVARLAEHDYFLTTTTANAASVLSKMEFLLATAWTDLDVQVTSVTDQWAAMAIAGPKSRHLLNKIFPLVDLSRTALPNMRFVSVTLGTVAMRLHRMSYSGELAYELYVPAGYGNSVWRHLLKEGEEFGVAPYGTEAMGTLRIEKGHVAGPELDGRTTLTDINMDNFASATKPFVGSVLRNREQLKAAQRERLVGLVSLDDMPLASGALLFRENDRPAGHGEGWISSPTYSPALQKYIALAFVKDGPAREGETMTCVNFVGEQKTKVKVVSPKFFDPQGERQNA